MSFFGDIAKQAGGGIARAIHLPEAEVPDAVAWINSQRPGLPPLTESDLRLVESMQAMYMTGKLVHVALPRQAQPLAGVVEGALLPTHPPQGGPQ